MMLQKQLSFPLFISVLLCIFLPFCQASFLSEPSIQWTYQLPGSGTLSERGLRSGNEVLSSPDGKYVFATADDGSLHFISTTNQEDSFVFEPDMVSGTYTECRSGVTLVHNPETNELDYVVYAVLDVPLNAGVLYGDMTYDSSRISVLSRLFAVNLDGSLRWSMPLNGAVAGKPLVGGEQNRKLYVVHNVPDYNSRVPTAPTRGKISVILLRSSNKPVLTASISPSNRYGPFGPPARTTVKIDGNSRDVVVVAEAWDRGYAESGSLFMLRPSSLYDDFDGQGNDAYDLRLISDWSFASVTRPALRKDGTEVFIGATAAQLGGWTGDNRISNVVAGSDSNLDPAWEVALAPNPANASQPLLVAPILSLDQSVLFQAGATTELYCVDVKTGDTVWVDNGAFRSAILAEPRMVELGDEAKVYAIESMTGRLRQHDALTGDVDWAMDCLDVSDVPCNDAVKADFSVSPTGETLYYGDIFGKIIAIRIGDAPTQSPTFQPTMTPEKKEQEEHKEVSQQDLSDKPNGESEKPENKPEEETVPAPTRQPVESPENDDGKEEYLEEVDENVKDAEKDDVDGVVVANNEDTTDSPTFAPEDLVFPNSPPQTSQTTVNSDEATTETPATTNLDSSAVIDSAEDDSSFFENNMFIILIAVCSVLALAIIVVLVAQKFRRGKQTRKAKKVEKFTADNGKALSQDEYEDACRRDEEETLREIVSLSGSTGDPKTPVQNCATPNKKNGKNQKKGSPVTETPATLATVEESPAECEMSLVSESTPKKVEGMIEAKNLENTFKALSSEKQDIEEIRRSPQAGWPPVQPHNSSLSDSAKSSSTSTPPILNSVEVIATPSLRQPQQKEFKRPKSPANVPESADYNANAYDLVSVDGSMYLDDDSMFQGSRFEVASLSQFSVASSRDGDSELAGYSMASGGRSTLSPVPGDAYRKATASPLLNPTLSPEVTEYLRKNKSSLSPNPVSLKGIDQDQKSPLSATSPLSTSTMGSNSGGKEKSQPRVLKRGESARSGQSGRCGGSQKQQHRSSQSRPETPLEPIDSSFETQRTTTTDGGDTSDSQSRSPSPPRPPVKSRDEPEDAWNSFLSELAKAEQEFFNPSFSKKKKANKKVKQARAMSPPPPPPPSYSPPESPNAGIPPPPPPSDPPVGKKKRQLL